ncbi:hypothetical protein [Mycolicibacterium sp. lyk4-40-TYG-92]|uniref:hypothetical protein n=1 Tax=Mycolicibacterium sp. lyk4-40-TYG-92 TaxID=3040295 RepID=UPI0025516C56|nr:hypothetical protein [Mycolicibacterium sp. lyk4-40-TYG-92]
MKAIEGPVDRAKVHALAVDWADDPSSVVEVTHDGFNGDELNGGYAFRCDRGMFICNIHGGRTWTIDPGTTAGRRAKIEEFWRQTQHQHRRLRLEDVSVWHRAAIAALVRGAVSVGDLPESERLGVTDIARADTVLIRLRRCTSESTEAAALRSLAAADWLAAVPAEDEGAHPCPLCGLPAIGRYRQYTSVCDDCYAKTVCTDGRIVKGYNTDFSGGFEAVHADDRSVCAQVTHNGLVSVDGGLCHMGEARFGGVFVGVDCTER